MSVGFILLVLLVLAIVIITVYVMEQFPPMIPYRAVIRGVALLLFLLWLYTRLHPLLP